MGITLYLKQISTPVLEILKRDPKQVELFYEAKWLPELSIDASKQEAEILPKDSWTDKFIAEWKIPDLDLHKYFPELTYLLAGYIPYWSERHLAIPELRSRSKLMQKNRFMEFLTIEDSEWDGLPLVNAIFAGKPIGKKETYRYQTSEEVGQILDGLLWISTEGFQARYRREAKSYEPCIWFDWEEEEMLDWLTDYYNKMVNYYRSAARRNNAMLIHLSV